MSARPTHTKCAEHTRQLTGCSACAEAFRRWQVGYRLDALEGRARMVPVLGSQRRLQALAVTGWSTPAVAEATGVTHRSVQATRGGESPRVSARVVADPIAEFYRRKAATPGRSTRTRNLAASMGWAHPDAWEGLDMDDPDAVPLVLEPNRDTHPHRTHLEDVEHLARSGASWWWVAQRLGVHEQTVERTLREAGRLDLCHLLARSSGGAWAQRTERSPAYREARNARRRAQRRAGVSA